MTKEISDKDVEFKTEDVILWEKVLKHCKNRIKDGEDTLKVEKAFLKMSERELEIATEEQNKLK